MWDPARGRSAVFHSHLVDHNIRLPPRKTRPASRPATSPAGPDSNTALASLSPRSPLSPLHPASPLFPDGLIAPIWVRKHREIVPSVFVAFHCLADPHVLVDEDQGPSEAGEDDTDRSQSNVEGRPPPPRQSGPSKRPLSGPELKARDEELVRLIADRKRTLTERGIKMTVVLVTEREMLDSQQLEARLSFIRRSSGLDSRASLFVLTPISRNELGDFVTSLQGALYDHALDYYRESARRVRRKRTRYPPPLSTVQPILQAVAASRPGQKLQDLTPLSREGWHVRAEFKLAMFAEWHGDYDMALSHYREAYDLLAGPRGMLGSTMLLPPRTKRWAEAKVLSDALSIRIARLHLYADDGSAAVAQFRNHVARFVELSSGWGIGDSTFEFWSWLGKQYRLMADLLVEAVRTNPGSPLPPFQIPTHISQLPGFLLHTHIADFPQNYPSFQAAPGALLSPNTAALASGIAPARQLQDPANFYYLAALCAQERQERFSAMTVQESNGELAQSGAAALVHEKKVDHCANIVEAFGKAHDLFKSSERAHAASFVAVKIASTYARHGRHKMALQFLQQSHPLYVDQEWHDVTKALLFLAIECAVECQDSQALIGLLMQALALANKMTDKESAFITEKWEHLQSDAFQPEGVESSSVDVTYGATRGPLLAEVVFKDPSVPLGADAAVQITVRSASTHHESVLLAFEEMTWIDVNNKQVVSVKDDPSDSAPVANGTLVQLGGLNDQQHSKVANLRWSGGSTKTFNASIRAEDRQALGISQVVFAGKCGKLDVKLTLSLPAVPPMSLPSSPLWRVDNSKRPWLQLRPREDPGRVRIDRPRHNVFVAFDHHETAFIDETINFVVRIENRESVELRGSVTVILQPAFPGSQDELASQGMRQPTLSGRLAGLDVGTIAPGESGQTTFTLKSKHRPRPRILQVIVHTSSSRDSIPADDEHASEVVKEVTLPVTRPFRAEFSAFWTSGSTMSASNPGTDRQSDQHLGVGSVAPFEDVAPRSPGGKSSSPWPDPQDVSTNSAVAVAHLHAAFAVLTAGVSIQIHRVQVEIDEDYSGDAKVIGGSDIEAEDSARTNSLQGEWNDKDRWSHTWQVEVALKEYAARAVEDRQSTYHPRARGPTGHLLIHWQRTDTKAEGPGATIANLPLPILYPPHLNARVLAASPPVVHMHQAFTLLFVVVNPSSYPVDVVVYLDDDPAWSIGHRSLTIPGVPPRGSRSVPSRLVPRVEGTWTLPRARAFHQRSREEIEESGGALLLNETHHGLPLHVRYRASAGATMGAAAQRAIASGQVPAEQEGSSLSVLVLNREDGS